MDVAYGQAPRVRILPKIDSTPFRVKSFR